MATSRVRENDFGVRIDELKKLLEAKGAEAKEFMTNTFGGVQSLAEKLKTNLQTGINGDEADVQKRIGAFGRNEIPPKPPKSIFRLAFEALQDATLILLIICAVVSIGLSFYHPSSDAKDEDIRTDTTQQQNLEWVEGVAIAIAVIVVVSVSSFNDWRKERKFRGLQDRIAKDNKSTVVRNGQIVQINVKELIVGDVCCIKYGDLIPADGVVIQSSDLKIDESSLTGETDLIKKDEADSFNIFSGTHVMEGSGQFLVLAVGLNSQTGIIMTLLGATQEKEEDKNDDDDDEDKSKTPQNDAGDKSKPKPKKPSNKKHQSVLQLKLGRLAVQIGYIGIASAILTFIILLVRMLIVELAIRKLEWSNTFIKYILSYLIQAITVVVVAVPEGLPLAVTLALAYAVQKMTKDNNLVRHLDACETMGNATTICSDKTGTLTTNRMTAVQCWIGGVLYKKIPEKTQVIEQIRNLIYESISVNTNYTSMIEEAKQVGEFPKQIGNKTECGLLGLVTELGGSYAQVRTQYPSDQFPKVYTFNSARKMMTTIVKPVDSSGYRLHSKGASEIVLNKCGYYLNAEGKPVKLSKEKIEDIIKNVVEQMACDGLRTICVACRDFIPSSERKNDSLGNAVFYDETPDWDDEPQIIKDLTCICLVGIEDPVRPEVPDAIHKCQTSGVVVRMVTGDNINTATSIAMKCGIIKPGDDFLILESKDFNKRIRDASGEVQQHLLDQVWPKLRVLARSSPTDKYILVNGIVESKLNANREVVAVTGDGTNDGPALKRADVGFAMGIQGTDVAKEASDIILTDDNFSSIVKAMMWGRNVYDAIAKFLQFQLTVNLVAGVLSVCCAAAIQSVPLKAVQMLWVNLVMDTLASLALATEPPTEELLKRKPYGRDKHIISLTMMKIIIGQGIYQLAVLFALIFGIENWMQVDDIVKYDDLNKLANPSKHFTIVFNVFVIMTLFNEINARKLQNERNVFSGIQNNLIFIIIWILCLIGQIIIVNFGGIVFSVEPIEWDHWMWSLFLGVGCLLWQQIILFFPDTWFEKIINTVFFCSKKKQNDAKKLSTVDESPVNELKSSAPMEKIASLEKLDTAADNFEKSKILWTFAVTKIQSQLQVVKSINNQKLTN